MSSALVHPNIDCTGERRSIESRPLFEKDHLKHEITQDGITITLNRALHYNNIISATL
jgi:hypothetical protein